MKPPLCAPGLAAALKGVGGGGGCASGCSGGGGKAGASPNDSHVGGGASGGCGETGVTASSGAAAVVVVVAEVDAAADAMPVVGATSAVVGDIASLVGSAAWLGSVALSSPPCPPGSAPWTPLATESSTRSDAEGAFRVRRFSCSMFATAVCDHR